MKKIDFKKLGLLSALETLNSEIMKIEPYIQDEVGIEKFDTAITTLDLIRKEGEEDEN